MAEGFYVLHGAARRPRPADRCDNFVRENRPAAERNRRHLGFRPDAEQMPTSREVREARTWLVQMTRGAAVAAASRITLRDFCL